MTDKIKSEDFIKAFGNGVCAKKVNSPIVFDCKYYLPCGRCEKTNEFCSFFNISVNNNGTVTK